MLTKSSLWATATPTAAKLPISDADGKLDAGWVRYNYAPVTTVSADTLLDASHCVVLVGAAATITLPTAAGIAGRLYSVVRTGTGDVAVDLGGGASLTLTSQGDSVAYVSDGAGWVRTNLSTQSSAGTVTRADISDATAAGRNLMAVATPSEASVPVISSAGAVTTAPLSSLGGGGGWTVAATPPTADYDCPWSSNGDSNGILYCLGSNLRSGEWANPHSSGAVVVTPSSSPSLAALVVDRKYAGADSTANEPDSSIRIDLGAARATITRYTIQNRSIGGDSHMIVNWVLEASIDGTVWTALHTGTGTPLGWSSGAWAGYAVADTTFWRYIRWRQVGANSSGAYYFCPGEIELYGTLRAGRLLPFGAAGWMTDGDSHYIPYYAG